MDALERVIRDRIGIVEPVKPRKKLKRARIDRELDEIEVRVEAWLEKCRLLNL